MTKVRRFYYVRAPRGKVKHLLYKDRTEGNPVSCGKIVQIGWVWSVPVRARLKLPVCKACLRAA